MLPLGLLLQLHDLLLVDHLGRPGHGGEGEQEEEGEDHGQTSICKENQVIVALVKARKICYKKSLVMCVSLKVRAWVS